MQVSADTALQILVNLAALALVYTRMEVKIAVIQNELQNIKARLGGGDKPGPG